MRNRRSLLIGFGFAIFLQQQPAQPPPGGQPATGQGGGLSFDLARGEAGLRALPVFPSGMEFRFSLCNGRNLSPNEAAPSCNPLTSKTVTGGHAASYVFAMAPGTFLPRGLSLDSNGVLRGAPEVDLRNEVIRVCVRQLNEVDACQNLGFGRVVAQEAAVQPPQRGGRAGEPGAPGGAAGAGGVPAAPEANRCGDVPRIPGNCVGIGRNSQVCRDAMDKYADWCKCNGGTFNRGTGACER